MSPTLRPITRRFRNTPLRVVQINSKRQDGRTDSYWTVTPLRNEDGKRYRPHFASKAEAEAEKGRRERERRLFGLEGSQMSTALRVDAIQAQRILAPLKATLLTAAKHYAAHLDKKTKTEAAKTVAEAAEAYLKEREREVKKGEIRAITIRNIRSRVGVFCNGLADNKEVPALGAMSLPDIGRAQINEFLTNLPFHGQTKAHYRAQIHSLLEFARQREWIEENPVSQLGRMKKKEKGAGVRVLSVAEAEELLEEAEKLPLCRILVPRLALGLFVGLRPSETKRVNWEDIDFNRKDVRVYNENKVEQERYVELNPTAYAWLKKYRGVGKIENASEGKIRKSWDSLRESLGWNITRTAADKKDWVSNILRHSYGSYMLGICGDDKYKVCALMGNSVPILNKHYRRAMPAKEAEPYWKILPENYSKFFAPIGKKTKKV